MLSLCGLQVLRDNSFLPLFLALHKVNCLPRFRSKAAEGNPDSAEAHGAVTHFRRTGGQPSHCGERFTGCGLSQKGPSSCSVRVTDSAQQSVSHFGEKATAGPESTLLDLPHKRNRGSINIYFKREN